SKRKRRGAVRPVSFFSLGDSGLLLKLLNDLGGTPVKLVRRLVVASSNLDLGTTGKLGSSGADLARKHLPLLFVRAVVEGPGGTLLKSLLQLFTDAERIGIVTPAPHGN